MIFATGLLSALLNYLLFTSSFNPILLAAALGFIANASWNLIITLAQDAVDKNSIGSATRTIQNASFGGGIFSPVMVGLLTDSIGLINALAYATTISFLSSGLIALAFLIAVN